MEEKEYPTKPKLILGADPLNPPKGQAYWVLRSGDLYEERAYDPTPDQMWFGQLREQGLLYETRAEAKAASERARAAARQSSAAPR